MITLKKTITLGKERWSIDASRRRVRGGFFWLYGRNHDDTTIKVGGWLAVGIPHIPWRYGVSCQAMFEICDLGGAKDRGHECYRR